MLWKEVIELGNQVETEVNFEVIKTWVFHEVFANKKSVRSSEFYQAATVGLKPELVFEIHTVDFSNEERVRFNDKEYAIVRVYELGETIELTVTSYTGSEV